MRKKNTHEKNYKNIDDNLIYNVLQSIYVTLHI